ncbi:MAG: ATPase [Bacteroidales bacterium]|nr:ATPase [Bacteroidales bacterium]
MVEANSKENKKENRRSGISLSVFKHILKFVPFLLSLMIVFLALFDFGFDQTPKQDLFLRHLYLTFFSLEFIIILIRYISNNRPETKVWAFDAVLLISILFAISAIAGWRVPSSLFDNSFGDALVIVMIFFREFVPIDYKRKVLNPAQIFMISFLLLIFAGTFVLMLPHATKSGISFIDALFTSTSAVCVTGLIVVDTGTYFTIFGQTAVLILIQLGGIGIITFTSYFSYFFTGGASYENQLLIQKMTYSDKITEVFGSLFKILLLTFLIEGIGAVLIYFSINDTMVASISEKIFFSVFHAISGFCNAGFSTLTDNLYDTNFRFNYLLQLIITSLLILGGIGFPILFNFSKYIKHLFVNKVFRKTPIHRPWVININTRIVVVTTALLLIFGTVVFYIFEYNSVLDGYTGIGKIITAFFSASTPRTAGFNTIDFATLQTPTILLVCFLMWVGASPGGTGGGIKTSTLAISIMNSINIARGKDRIDFRGREISGAAVRRAYSQIFLSLTAIGLSVLAVELCQDDLDLKAVIFECISAFSTVGLSLGITAKLCAASKLILIFTMFVGRISLLTVLVAFLKQGKAEKFRFPSEDILIN